MTEKKRREKIGLMLISALLFCILLFLFGGNGTAKEKHTVQIVVFGDSAYGNVRDESAISAQLGRLLGKTAYNAGFGGTCVGRISWDTRLDFSGSSLSMVALAKAVYADDFSVQQTIKPVPDITFYFGETIEGLTAIDFSAVEAVLIGHGSNDYTTGIPLENKGDAMDEYTFAGALRKSVTMLRKANPGMRIVLLTPTYSWLLGRNMTCEEYDTGEGILEDYVLKELEVAEELDVEVIDLYHDFFPHEKWEDWELYTMDGLHPNEAGRAWIAEKIAEYLGGEAK
ncbi:MAG: SGNH/GDSL hydrolase family protein [bacterium]|nr:SGNH/GDSL hydrolase family protein [bacterium]